MNREQYKLYRILVVLFISVVVGIAQVQDSYLLSIVAVLTGMLFMLLVRRTAKLTADEREITVREKAAQLTYAIITPTIGLGSFLMLIPSQSGLSVFSKGEFAFLESLGMVFAYLTLFIITIHALSFYFINKQYGGGKNE